MTTLSIQGVRRCTTRRRQIIRMLVSVLIGFEKFFQLVREVSM